MANQRWTPLRIPAVYPMKTGSIPSGLRSANKVAANVPRRLASSVAIISPDSQYAAKALLLQRHKHRRRTSLCSADDKTAECKSQNTPGPVAKDRKAEGNASHYSI